MKPGLRTTALKDPGRKGTIRKASWERLEPKWLVLQEAAGTSVPLIVTTQEREPRFARPSNFHREAGNPDFYRQFLNY